MELIIICCFLLIGGTSIIIADDSPPLTEHDINQIIKSGLPITTDLSAPDLMLAIGGKIFEDNNVMIWEGECDDDEVAFKIFWDSNTMRHELGIYEALGALNDEEIEEKGVPRVYYHGPILGGYYAIAMTLFDGTLVDHYHWHGERFSDLTVLMIFKRSIEILKYFHSKNMVHNDVKPENIFVRGNEVFIGDFDISTLNGADNDFGTKRYVSANYWAKNKRGAMDDLESLLYTMWTVVHIPVGEAEGLTLLHYIYTKTEKAWFMEKYKNLSEDVRPAFQFVSNEVIFWGLNPNYDQMIKKFDMAIKSVREKMGQSGSEGLIRASGSTGSKFVQMKLSRGSSLNKSTRFYSPRAMDKLFAEITFSKGCSFNKTAKSDSRRSMGKLSTQSKLSKESALDKSGFDSPRSIDKLSAETEFPKGCSLNKTVKSDSRRSTDKLSTQSKLSEESALDKSGLDSPRSIDKLSAETEFSKGSSFNKFAESGSPRSTDKLTTQSKLSEENSLDKSARFDSPQSMDNLSAETEFSKGSAFNKSTKFDSPRSMEKISTQTKFSEESSLNKNAKSHSQRFMDKLSTQKKLSEESSLNKSAKSHSQRLMDKLSAEIKFSKRSSFNKSAKSDSPQLMNKLLSTQMKPSEETPQLMDNVSAETKFPRRNSFDKSTISDSAGSIDDFSTQTKSSRENSFKKSSRFDSQRFMDNLFAQMKFSRRSSFDKTTKPDSPRSIDDKLCTSSGASVKAGRSSSERLASSSRPVRSQRFATSQSLKHFRHKWKDTTDELLECSPGCLNFPPKFRKK